MAVIQVALKDFDAPNRKAANPHILSHSGYTSNYAQLVSDLIKHWGLGRCDVTEDQIILNSEHGTLRAGQPIDAGVYECRVLTEEYQGRDLKGSQTKLADLELLVVAEKWGRDLSLLKLTMVPSIIADSHHIIDSVALVLVKQNHWDSKVGFSAGPKQPGEVAMVIDTELTKGLQGNIAEAPSVTFSTSRRASHQETVYQVHYSPINLNWTDPISPFLTWGAGVNSKYPGYNPASKVLKPVFTLTLDRDIVKDAEGKAEKLTLEVVVKCSLHSDIYAVKTHPHQRLFWFATIVIIDEAGVPKPTVTIGLAANDKHENLVAALNAKQSN